MKQPFLLNEIKETINNILFFIEKPQLPYKLALFRISIGVFSIIKILLLGNNFIDVYGQYGIIQWAVTKSAIYSFLPHAGDFLSIFRNENSDTLLFTIRNIYIGLLFFFVIGFFSRIVALLCCFLHLMFLHTGGGLTYGVDVFTQIALFYSIFMPIGDCFSLDAKIRKTRPTPSIWAGFSIRVLQIFLCLMYLSSGFEKALGIQWWNGEAIWRTMMLPSFKQFDMSFLAIFPIVPKTLGWIVLTIELGYPVFIWIPKIRSFFLIFVFGLHLSIGIFLGMWLFGLIMIIFSATAFGEEAYSDIKRRPTYNLLYNKPKKRFWK